VSLSEQSGPMLSLFDWLEEGSIAACAYPNPEAVLAELAGRGITVLINLHERPHAADVLARNGLAQVHLPVPDFTPPTPDQLEQGVEAIGLAAADGKRVAVHCGAGLGRTGTLLACYLVSRGLDAREAINRVRAARPGSIETPEQEAAVEAYADRLRRGAST
jgi:atypical dual specificity phosphatase